MIKLDQDAIKIAAENFMQALTDWGSKDKIQSILLKLALHIRKKN